MTTALSVGAKTETKTLPGAFVMNWVTVWGAPVNPALLPGLLIDLKAQGFEVQARGHYVMTQWSADDADHIERVREAILAFTATNKAL